MQKKLKRRSLKSLVGARTYAVWTEMLSSSLVPDGRTHRLSPLVAAMLKHAEYVADEKPGSKNRGGSVASSLAAVSEIDDPLEAMEEIGDVVETLFVDAGVPGERVSARGESYSVIENSIAEFVRWYNMPWE